MLVPLEALMNQGTAGFGVTFLYADKGSLPTWAAARAIPCHVPGTLYGWMATGRAPEGIYQVLWWWLCGNRWA